MSKTSNGSLITYLKVIIKGLINKKYRTDIINVYKEKDDLYCISKYGNENAGKTIFLYDENSVKQVGFFAIYRFMIEACWFCEQLGFVPVIHFGDNCFYANNGEEINGKTDAFEHFFQQPSGISYDSSMKSNAVILSTYNKRDVIRRRLLGEKIEYLGYEVNDDYLRTMASCANRFIRLNTELEKKMMIDINSLLQNKKTLAVHVRIKVFQKGIDRHPIPAQLEEYLDKVSEALTTCKFEQVFLATSENDTIDILPYGSRMTIQ